MCDLRICIICLNKNVRGYSMNTKNLREYYGEIINIQLAYEDQLPSWLCYECSLLLHKFHKFREKCLKGRQILVRLLKNQSITYKTVSRIKRYNEKLNSALSLTVSSDHVNTYEYKHCNKPPSIELEQIIVNCNENEYQKEEIIIYETPETIEEDNKDNLISYDLKQETVINSVGHVNIHFGQNDVGPNIDDDSYSIDDSHDNTDYEQSHIEYGHIIDNSHGHKDDTIKLQNHDQNDKSLVNIDDQKREPNEASSDDENVFLDILKKVNNGDKKLVVLKKKRSKKRESKKEGTKKFTKPKKDHFPPDSWRKISMTEEQALEEFRKREFDPKYVKANYKCLGCFKGFSRADILERHLKFRHEESIGDIQCRFCSIRFGFKHQLRKHLATHYTIYQCLICDMRFNLETSALFHAGYHSGELKKCKHCGMTFKHVSTYYSHVRTTHRSAHVCAACGASFVSSAGLTQHAKRAHYNEQAVSEAEANSKYCDKCDIKFLSHSAYDKHLVNSNMHNEAGTPGNSKERSRNSRLGFKPRANRRPTTCIHCGEHFPTQAACMKHHIAMHPRKTFFPNDMRHICEICGASLAAVSIASHMNNHTRETMYPCETCGMQFTSKSSHHRHQITHTGEKKYPCPLCDKRFTQRGSMKLHYRTFHLKQPYPKRTRKKKTDEIPLVESCRNRSEIDDSEPIAANRWR